MIAIIDYDAGNIKSVEKAFEYLSQETVTTRDPEILLKADKVVLPGVGSFGDAMNKLHEYNLVDVIREIVNKGTPLLGICLGLQLLFESSEESVGVPGLGILKGHVLRFSEGTEYKIPQIGWNSLEINPTSRLFRGIDNQSYVYFVHSYFAELSDATASESEYGINFTAAVSDGNIYGCQFHPEKSGDVGLNILRGFCEA